MAARPFFTSGRYAEGLESGNKKPETGITRALGDGGLQFVRVRTADGGVCDEGPALFSRIILHGNLMRLVRAVIRESDTDDRRNAKILSDVVLPEATHEEP